MFLLIGTLGFYGVSLYSLGRLVFIRWKRPVFQSLNHEKQSVLLNICIAVQFSKSVLKSRVLETRPCIHARVLENLCRICGTPLEA